MFLSIFTDELGVDITKGLPALQAWGVDAVDLRGRVFGMAAEALPPERLPELRELLDSYSMRVGCLQSSLAKVHLPGPERRARELEKLEGIIRVADALDCRLVRSFHYWQPGDGLKGQLAVRPDELQKVLDAFAPLARRAQEVGLQLAFENCGVEPDEVFTVLDALDVPQWGMAWDVNNGWDCDARRSDEDAYIRRMVMRTKCVHVKAKGCVPGLEPYTIPYDKVLQMCHNGGIQGPVSVETHNPDRTVSNKEMSERVVKVLQKSWPSAAPGGLFGSSGPEIDVERSWQDDPVGFVVVGLGMGHNRAKTVKETPGTRLVGVCDIDEGRAKRSSEAYAVPYTREVESWLSKDEVDVIYVMTETGNHAQVALQALAAGKHVLTTKPMEATLAACDAMIREAEDRDLILGVDFGRRFSGELNTLKAVIEAGALGRLLSGTSTLKIQRTMDYFRANGGWRGTRRWDGGGVLSNQAIHHIDELAYAIGPPAKVRCDLWTQMHEIEAEDLGVAAWMYESGLVISFSGTTSYPHPTWYHALELVGAEGAYARFSGGPFSEPLERWYVDGAWQDRAPVTAASEWLNAADNFAAALRMGEPLMCSGRDGRRTQAILDAMYRSAYEADGGWVDVSPDLESVL